MEGVLTRHVRLAAVVVCGAAMLFSSVALGACRTQVADGHGYPAGDTQWVGHTAQELHTTLGTPSFRLGKPYLVSGDDDYTIDVYTAPQPASAGCVDAYKINECGVIIGYFCR